MLRDGSGGKDYRHCIECGAKIGIPIDFLGSESEFCEDCELADYEGKHIHHAT